MTGIKVDGPGSQIAVTLPSGGVTTLAFTDRASNYTVNLPFGVGQINPMTTVGDMIVGVADGVESRLPIGAEGYYLKVSGGIPAWASAPKGSAVSDASETVASVKTQLNALLASLRTAGIIDT